MPRAPRLARNPAPEAGPALPNEPELCAQAEATRELAAEVRKLTDELVIFAKAAEPALNTVTGFGERLDALCLFFRKRGPWILASAPGVLVAIGAVSPNAAKWLATFLAGLHG